MDAPRVDSYGFFFLLLVAAVLRRKRKKKGHSRRSGERRASMVGKGNGCGMSQQGIEKKRMEQQRKRKVKGQCSVSEGKTKEGGGRSGRR